MRVPIVLVGYDANGSEVDDLLLVEAGSTLYLVAGQSAYVPVLMSFREYVDSQPASIGKFPHVAGAGR